MNYYERHIGDYLKDTAHLSLLEHGVYTRLMDVYYTRETGIPPADAGRLVGARTKEERAALASVLAEFFTLNNGLHTQPRCAREIEQYQKRVAHNREVGKLGGRPRKTEPGNNPVGYGKEPAGNPPQSPSPISHLPEPSVRDARRAHTLPKEFQEAMQSRPELDAQEVYGKFLDHYPDGKRTLTVWRTWVKNERVEATASDPDSRASIEALGLSCSMGKWDELKEPWASYKARVKGGIAA